MKALKVFTLCFAVCSLFAGMAPAQCVVGVAVSVSGELDFCGSGISANNAGIGQTIVYSVLIETSLFACPISNAVASLTLPDGTIIPIGIPSDLPPDYSGFFPCIGTYVVAADDLGQLAVDISPGGTDPTQSNEVRALASVSGTAATGGGNTDEATASAVRTTTIGQPCVEVTKTPDCDETIVGDNVYYIIEITNCGDTDLELVSFTDTMFPEWVPDVTCLTLAPGSSCLFSTPNHLITESDPDPLENTVTVVYNGLIGTTVIGQVDDDDDAEIDIVHPDFTVTKTCETPIVLLGQDADFEIIITNTGDVALDFATDDPAIGPFSLEPGEDLTQTVNKTAEACPTVENTISVTASYAGGTEECQTWEDTKSPEAGPAVCDVVDPEFTVEKVCLDNPVTGDTASFEITITNTTTCGVIDLDFEYTDLAAGIDVPVQVGPFGPGQSYVATVEVPTVCLEGGVSNTVLVEAFYNGQSVGTDQATAVCPCGVPDFTVEKTCVSDPVIDANAVFEINICNTGDIALMFEIDDAAAGIVDMLVGPIAAGECDTITVYVPAECVNGEVSNTAIVQALNGDQPVLDPKEATAVCPCAGQEGCTPGFWKNHPDCWACYSTTTKLNEVFDFTGTPSQIAALGNDTLLNALSYGGGSTKKQKLQILLRHAVAAVLNACSGNVEYPDDVAGVVAAVNGILANWDETTGKEILSQKNIFQDWNELGCPIDAHCNPIPDEEMDGLLY